MTQTAAHPGIDEAAGVGGTSVDGSLVDGTLDSAGGPGVHVDVEDIATLPRWVDLVVGPGVIAVMGAAAVTAAMWRSTGNDVSDRAGVLLLLAAVALGLPHGALDTELLPAASQGSAVRAWLLRLTYPACAVAVYLAWWRWPVTGVAVLLTVSAAHFAAADWSITRWRHPPLTDRAHRIAAALRTGSTGTLAVAGPFAWWPDQTRTLLAHLDAGEAAAAVTAVCRVIVAGALLVAAVALSLTALWSWRRGSRLEAWEPFAVAAVTATCPPLAAFAVYFAGWHALRQTVRLLTIHPGAARALTSRGTRAALALLARRAALPTAVAAAVLLALTLLGKGASATVLAGLLAVSVPHAAVTVWREHTH